MRQALLFIAAFSLILFSCATDETPTMEPEVIEVTDDTTEEESEGQEEEEQNEESADVPKLPIKIDVISSNSSEVTFDYDEENNLIETSLFNDGNLSERTILNYINGNLQESIRYDANGNFNGYRSLYITENGVISERQFYNNDQLEETEVYFYNSQGLLTRVETTVSGNSEVDLVINYDYDSNNNVSARYFNFTELEDDILDEYTYDEMNNPFKNFEPKIIYKDLFFTFVNNYAQSIITNLNTGSSETLEYTYTYDEDGYPLTQQFGGVTYEYEYNQ